MATFSALCVQPPTVSELIPTDLTAIMPSKQLYLEYEHDNTEESELIKIKVEKLVNLLEKGKLLSLKKEKEKEKIKKQRISKSVWQQFSEECSQQSERENCENV